MIARVCDKFAGNWAGSVGAGALRTLKRAQQRAFRIAALLMMHQTHKLVAHPDCPDAPHSGIR